MVGDLRIQLDEEDADQIRLDRLTRLMRQELVQLDVDDVTVISAGSAPSGARAVDPAVAEGLLIALGTAAQGLAAVIALTREWRKRSEESVRKVRYEIDGDVLELTGASEADEDRIVMLFINRHSRGKRGR